MPSTPRSVSWTRSMICWRPRRRGFRSPGRPVERGGPARRRSFQRRYPHQLSGGQQQRVCIAMSLACDPAVVVLDEPTTGLDVVSQSRILDQLLRLKTERDVAMLYVTHDLAVVARLADRVAVMYAGRIVERGRVDEVLRRPKHPYTRGLLASIPDHRRPRVLEPMPGIVAGVGIARPDAHLLPVARRRLRGAWPRSRRGSRRRRRKTFAASSGPGRLGWRWFRSAARNQEGAATSPVLAVRSLCAEHGSRHETVVAAQDVSFDVASRGMRRAGGGVGERKDDDRSRDRGPASREQRNHHAPR